jgi:hypothetical protein
MPDIETFLESHSHEVFYLPYLLAQVAIGETDGGIAGLFESDGCDYKSGFANAGGHHVISKLFEHFPEDEILDRLAKIETPEIQQRFESAELMTEASILEISEEVTRLWHGALQKAFPEIAGHIGDWSASTRRAVERYLKFQHIYSDEYEQKLSSQAHP